MKSIVFLIFISSLAFSKSLSNTHWELQRSDLEYTVVFPLKTVKGHNTDAKGKAICKASSCDFLVGAEVVKFDSGDRNRDLHMRETTKAALFPVVTVRGVLPSDLKQEKVDLDLEVEFAGVKKHFAHVPFLFKQVDNELDVSGEMSLSLKDFGLKAPTLLGVSIDDQVPLKIQTHWIRGS